MYLKRKIKYKMIKLYMWTYGLFHKIEKKVAFDSFCGKQYSDSPRAISEKIHELYPEYKIVWNLKSGKSKYKEIIPDYVTVVEKKEFLKQLATSFAYVTNENMEDDKYKRKKQLFIQTWHGDRAFKKILYDAWEDKKRPMPVLDNKITNLCIAGSDFGERIYRSAFNYNGEILKIGMPRNDILVNIKENRNKINEIKQRLKISNEKMILLFAPTFRDNNKSKQNTLVDLERILEKLSNKYNKDWICLVRAHSTSGGLDVKCNDKIVNVTDYPDMTDLLLISDMLITDYSSCAGDFILKNKPVILATFDREEYESKCREFYFKIEDTGFLIANNQQELEEIIEEKEEKDYIQNCENVKKYFKINETGTSTKEICDRINKFAKENKI